jgi:hypothetical protein
MGGKSGRNERVAACVEGIIAWRVRRHRERYGPGAEAGKRRPIISRPLNV